MQTTKQLGLLDLEERARQHSVLAELGKPFNESDRIGLCKCGLRWALHMAEHALGWIWHQWLLGTPHADIKTRVALFVTRGLELRRQSQCYEKLPHHDLLLLHCAIFASDESQLMDVVRAIGDASGDKGETPMDVGGLYAVAVGELYAAAWCGMMKYSILGNEVKATEQYNLIWKAKRDLEFVAAPKALATAWFKRDWNAFIKQQEKDFDRYWNRARKHSWSVKSEDSREIVATTRGYEIGHMWCWSHCGMALLAHRNGIKVATDPLWFPRHALE
jgi:hypothetical protein